MALPNWCSCDLVVRAKSDVAGAEPPREFVEELGAFEDYAKGDHGVLDANRFIPYPKRFADLDEKARKYREKTGKWDMKDGYNSGGYEWCVARWGTKWGICEPRLVRRTRRALIYAFDTAWSPPAPVVIKMSEVFPDLEFELRYYERGVGFKGVLVYRAGRVLRDDTSGYRGSRGG